MSVKFTGTNKRRAHRRQAIDRRTAIRWEPSKDDRRQSYGRRKEDRTWRLTNPA